MKSTLVIDDTVMVKVKEKAARDRTTISEIVEAALRNYLEPKDSPRDLQPLPSWNLGQLPVDVSDKDALYEFLEDDEYMIRRGFISPPKKKRR